MAADDALEINIDTLVGPTHTFGGLAWGNIASQMSKAQKSYPRKAALQSLEKMKLVHDLGIPQIILPPQPRPDILTLQRLGFTGGFSDMVRSCLKTSQQLLLSCSSSSSMWTANSATVTPSSDTDDGRLHITIANLASEFHRSIEAPFTERLFRHIFSNPKYFVIHGPLPATPQFFDEGAANHTRFCTNFSKKGIHLFVWGKASNIEATKKFPARQSKEAGIAIVRRHGLNPHATLFAQQNPKVIDKGVFHNDVIATGNRSIFLVHEHAYVNTKQVLSDLKKLHPSLLTYVVTEKELTVDEAVRSYFFNIQIVSLPNEDMAIIAPQECYTMPRAKRLLEKLTSLKNTPITEIFYLPLNESMMNGGGPACLRLRVVLTKKERQALPEKVFFSEKTYAAIKKCIESHYPETLTIHSFKEPQFHKNCSKVVKKIAEILGFSHLYDIRI